VQDVLKYVNQVAGNSLDFVIFTEVTFFLPSYRQVLKEIYRVLKPGGTAFVAFRSQYFYILLSARDRKWDSVEFALQKREGYLWGGQTWFSWQTKEDIDGILKSCWV